MLSELVIGGQQDYAPGSQIRLRGNRSASAMVADSTGRYVDAVSRKKVFIGSNLGGTPVTSQAGLSATTPALTLFNPVGSGYNLAILACGVAFNAAPAAASQIWLAHNAINLAGVPTAPTSTTTATVTSALLGALDTPAGQCFRIATLSAAPLLTIALGGTSGAAAIDGVALWFDLGGIVTVGQGVAVSFQFSSAAAVCCTFVWEEVPA